MNLYSFQEETLERIAKAPKHRFIPAYDTGLGKTIVAIMALRNHSARRVLIVTPAIVRENWIAEMEVWWPAHPTLAQIIVGRGRSSLSKKAIQQKEVAYAADIQVVSYSLLEHVDPKPWDWIIFDESHRLKNVASKQSKAARAIASANPMAGILLLTATPMPNNVVDIWNQLDIVWPGRFGRSSNPRYPSWQFCNRYSLDVGGEYGTKWEGINPAHADELRAKLSQISHRVTKHEVAHLLPPFIVQLTKVDAAIPGTTVEEWLANQGDAKLGAVQQWAENVIESGDSNMCILTHLRETAATISAALVGLGRTIITITGSQSPEERNALLARAKEIKGSVIVATMHSVGIGINLGFCQQVLFAELYYRPETLIQALGRFDGFRAKEPVNAQILVVKGSLDERIAKNVLKKMESINQAIRAGVSEEKLTSTFEGVKMTDDEAIAALNQALDLGEEWL